MNAFYLLLGIFLLAFAVTDALWTTLWITGSAGPLSTRLTTWLWRGLRTLAPSNQSHRVLSLSGPLTLTMTLLTWLGLLWAGWTFLFAADPFALESTIDKGTYAGWMERIYFAGYTLFTLGNGDFSPQGNMWRIVTTLTTASGMVLITLAVSYVLSVLSAAVNRRAFASQVSGIGDRSTTFLLTGWNETDFHALDLPLNALSSQLNQIAEQHLAYPILYYYHSQNAHTAVALSVVILDEALTILQHGIPEAQQPNPAILNSMRSSLDNYLESLSTASIRPAQHAPAPPDLERLRQAGIPTRSDEEFAAALRKLQNRRKKLLGMIDNAAWAWPPS